MVSYSWRVIARYALLCHAELGTWGCSWTGKPNAAVCDTHWQIWPKGGVGTVQLRHSHNEDQPTTVSDHSHRVSQCRYM